MLPQPVESSWIANKRSDTAENAVSIDPLSILLYGLSLGPFFWTVRCFLSTPLPDVIFHWEVPLCPFVTNADNK